MRLINALNCEVAAMKSYIRMLPGHKEEVIAVSEDPNEPIDITNDPDDTVYSVDSFEDYKDFVNRVRL